MFKIIGIVSLAVIFFVQLSYSEAKVISKLAEAPSPAEFLATENVSDFTGPVEIEEYPIKDVEYKEDLSPYNEPSISDKLQGIEENDEQFQNDRYEEFNEQGEVKNADDGEYEKLSKDQNENKDGNSSGACLFKLPGIRPRLSLENFLRLENPARFESTSQKNDHSESDKHSHSSGSDSHFSYLQPEKWSSNNPECSGHKQSPIDLIPDNLIGLDVPSDLIWTGYCSLPKNMTLSNTGHSAELKGIWASEMTPFITGGPLIGDYLFAQLHFHWGAENNLGSEHTINNKSLPMEMHMVHYKRNYGSLTDALNHPDGLAVVAFLYEICESPNSGLNLISENLNKARNKPGLKVPLKPFPLSILHSEIKRDYATYIGSLTTPPCSEAVTWIVSARSLSVSEKQMEAFRKMGDQWPGKLNFRPTQPLDGRGVYYVGL